MKKSLLIIVLLLIAGGIAYFLVSKSRNGKELAVIIGQASVGDITSVVTSTGKIYPETEVKISSEVAGEIIELPVTDGQKVKKGDLVVSVDPEILATQVKQQDAALAASKATSHQAYAQMLQAELNLKRLKSLFEKGFATQDQVDESSTVYEVAKASHAASLSRIQQQEMQLEEAQNRLSKASTYAPIDGSITVVHLELGDRVVGTGQFSGTEILRIADLNRMEVRVDVSEADIVNVKIDDLAEVEIDAIPDQKFLGKVTEIANSASTSGSGSQEQLTTFEVKVRLLEPTEAIRPGMTATADIQTQSVKDVVRVPLQSVTVRSRAQVAEQLGEAGRQKDKDSPKEKTGRNTKGDNLQRVVFLVRDDKVILTPVETGIADNRWIEIKSGVAADDPIVTGGYRVLTRELTHDATVKVEEAKKTKGPSRW